MEFTIELRPHIGVTAVGTTVELPQFLIYVSGDGVQELRKKPDEHIGYVGKGATDPINYLPVAAAFGEDRIKQFNMAIRQGLVEKAKQRIEAARALIAEAEQLKAEAESLGDSPDAQNAVATADQALQAAMQDASQAEASLEAESSATRAANEPPPLEVLLRRIKADEQAAADRTPMEQAADEANRQNL